MKNFFNKLFKLLFHNKYLPGIIFCLGITLPAFVIHNKFPFIPSYLFAILFGMIIAIGEKPEALKIGSDFCENNAIKYSLVFSGFGVSLLSAFSLNIKTYIIIALIILISFLIAFLLTKVLKTDKEIGILTAVGISVFGILSIGSVKNKLKSDSKKTAYAINSVLILFVLSAIILPLFIKNIFIGEEPLSLFIGTVFSDTATVKSLSSGLAKPFYDLALSINSFKAILLIPVVLIFYFIYKNSHRVSNEKTTNQKSSFKDAPFFLIVFIVAILIGSFLNIPLWLKDLMQNISDYLLCMGLIGIGLNVKISDYIKTSLKPLLIAFVLLVSAGFLSYHLINMI